MNSNSEKTIGSNSSLKPNSQSFNFENIISKQNKPKNKNKKGIHTNNRIYEYQRKKGDFKYLEKYIYKHFISLYKNSKNDYNSRMIEDILNNESTHLVAELKDYLIMGDITEFLQKSYNIKECKKYLPKIYDYYNSCSVIFPNYVNLHESKYIYKNIRKKQKVIDNQQEQEEKQEKIKKGNIKLENNEDFFTTKIFNSILDQTNTSNVKLLFGLNDKIDANETPNNIMVKLENAEKEVMRRKITLIKNNKNSRKINDLMENNNTINNININNKNMNITSNNSNNNTMNKVNNNVYIKNLKCIYNISRNKNNIKGSSLTQNQTGNKGKSSNKNSKEKNLYSLNNNYNIPANKIKYIIKEKDLNNNSKHNDKKSNLKSEAPKSKIINKLNKRENINIMNHKDDINLKKSNNINRNIYTNKNSIRGNSIKNLNIRNKNFNLTSKNNSKSKYKKKISNFV
jgi:hypothetical protein